MTEQELVELARRYAGEREWTWLEPVQALGGVAVLVAACRVRLDADGERRASEQLAVAYAACHRRGGGQ